MSANQSNSNLWQLFNELHRFEQSSDFEKALKVANKILNEEKTNSKALHCKIVSQIHLGSFEDALSDIKGCDQTLGSMLLFEKSYCEYRLNDVVEALKTLDSIKESDFRVKELRAQALYRLEQFDECYDQYLELIKNSDDDYEDERETNLAAVVASLSIENKDQSLKNKPELGEQTYELCYNKACVLLGAGKYTEALLKLNTAEDLCRKTLSEEEATEEEIESELGIIRAQIGFCYQMQKKDETALRMYNQILKQKPTDSALLAVTSNNIVTINKDQNVFDSKKKIKTALSETSTDSKLSKAQRQTIIFNNCLLLLHTNQSDSCRKQLEELKNKYPDAISEAILLEASLLCKEKKVLDAIKFLKQSSKQNADLVLEVTLVLSQLLIRNGDISEACRVLRSLGDVSYKPGITSTLVALYLSLEDKESATNLLTEAVNWYEKNQPQSSELFVLYRENARFLMETGQPKAAVNLLEQLRKNNPKNPKIVSLLINAYSQFNPQKAHEISKDLPPIDSVLTSIDVDQLETSNWSLGAKYVKKTTKTDTPTGISKTKDKDNKNKRKKKKQLPKNYDPSVEPDPERWLPRYERSTFKKKKDKRGAQGVGKGTQGAVGEIDIKPSPRTVTSNATTNSPQGPRQQRPTQKKKKKTARR